MPPERYSFFLIKKKRGKKRKKRKKKKDGHAYQILYWQLWNRVVHTFSHGCIDVLDKHFKIGLASPIGAVVLWITSPSERAMLPGNKGTVLQRTAQPIPVIVLSKICGNGGHYRGHGKFIIIIITHLLESSACLDGSGHPHSRCLQGLEACLG